MNPMRSFPPHIQAMLDDPSPMTQERAAALCAWPGMWDVVARFTLRIEAVNDVPTSFLALAPNTPSERVAAFVKSLPAEEQQAVVGMYATERMRRLRQIDQELGLYPMAGMVGRHGWMSLYGVSAPEARAMMDAVVKEFGPELATQQVRAALVIDGFDFSGQDSLSRTNHIALEKQRATGVGAAIDIVPGESPRGEELLRKTFRSGGQPDALGPNLADVAPSVPSAPGGSGKAN